MLTDLPWLTEVHPKIWNQKDLRPQLFRGVEVTREHYVTLQQRLKELHPDRDSPDYDSTNPDVLSVKLDLLRSLTPAEALSPRHCDEDELEIKSLFPFILSFLDLSTLGLEQKVPIRLPLPLLIREEYKHISELIRSPVIVSQPGTGEFFVSLSHRISPALLISR